MSPAPAVFSGVARSTRVCSYDRPGTIRYTDPPRLTTRSTPVKMPRTLPEMATDLRALLRKSGIRGPYTLVGHSFGGMIVRLFAQTYPSKSAGLVLVDSFGTNIRSLFGPDLWPGYVELLNHPGTSLDSDPSFETVDIDGAIDAILQAPALPRIPLAVMSKTEPFATAPGVSPAITSKLDEVWPLVQDALVALNPQTPTSSRPEATTTFRSTTRISRSARSGSSSNGQDASGKTASCAEGRGRCQQE